MEKRDVLIIGAGLLGCFAARALSRYELSITVLEAREDVCTGISRANTGIVYTGADTKPGTLKTELTVRANARFDALCRELDVRFRRCGSLMAAFGPNAERVLRKKYENGQKNGVPGLELLSGAECRECEPILSAGVTLGLYAPGTGTVDPWELGLAAYENARDNGAEFRFDAPLRALRREGKGFIAETENESYSAKTVINCAGLAADAVRELTESPSVRLFPDGGDYLVLDRGTDRLLHHVLFHEGEEKGKGLTLVPTVDGNVLVGPTELPWDGVSHYPARETGLQELRRLCREIVPALPLTETIRSFGALRPNPYYVQETPDGYVREERSISSFTLLSENGLFSLLGIKTPGLTCASELGEYVSSLVLEHLGGAAEKTDFDPRRRAIPRPRELPEAERAALIAAESAYGKLVCRCTGVTEGEVLEAIRRGAVTLDGVKRRTGSSMGRCQGSFCAPRILEILARELHCSPGEIRLGAAGTEYLWGGRDGTL